LDFEVGNICEIDFNKRKILSVVVEVLEMNDAKVEIRSGNFKTKKIEKKLDKNEEERFTKKQFKLIQEFADRFLVSVGEVVFALDNLHKQKKFKKFFNKEGRILDEIVVEDFDLEKYIQYQAPHISQIHLLVLYLKLFSSNSALSPLSEVEGLGVRIVFKTAFLGTSEKYFLDNLDIPYKLIEEKGKAKKYIYNRSNRKFNDEDVTNQEKVLDDEILKILNESQKEGVKTFIFVLAHGYQSSIYCKDCKSSYNCDKCEHNYSILNEQEADAGPNGDESMNFKRYLYCKNCENKKLLKDDQYLICKKCGGWGLFPFGEGGQKVYEELAAKFDSNKSIIFIDEANKKMTPRKITMMVQEFLNSKEKVVLLGTIRVLKELKSQTDTKVQTVVTSLGPISGGKNFDADEKFIKILSKLETVSNKIFIGKKNIEDNVLEKYKSKEGFVEEELKLRNQFKLPPFTKVISLSFDKRQKF
jgi:primosomal protein N'